MLNGNGHSNGHTNGQPNGKLAPPPEGECDRKYVVQFLNHVQKNLDAYTSDPTMVPKLMAWLLEVAADKSSRQRVRAMELLMKAHLQACDQLVKLSEFRHHSDRLEAGKSTENVAVFKVTIPEARDRLGLAD